MSAGANWQPIGELKISKNSINFFFFFKVFREKTFGLSQLSGIFLEIFCHHMTEHGTSVTAGFSGWTPF